MADVAQDVVDEAAKTLGNRLQQLIDETGLSGFEVETLILKQKSDVTSMGLLPGCELKCELSGFPPKIDCRVVCG